MSADRTLAGRPSDDVGVPPAQCRRWPRRRLDRCRDPLDRLRARILAARRLVWSRLGLRSAAGRRASRDPDPRRCHVAAHAHRSHPAAHAAVAAACRPLGAQRDLRSGRDSKPVGNDHEVWSRRTGALGLSGAAVSPLGRAVHNRRGLRPPVQEGKMSAHLTRPTFRVPGAGAAPGLSRHGSSSARAAPERGRHPRETAR